MSLYANDHQPIHLIIPGSILTRNILGLGLGFFSGGITQRVQHYNPDAISTTASLKLVCLIPLVLCSLLILAIRDEDVPGTPTDRDGSIILFSRGAAIVSLAGYIAYWFFWNITHQDLFRTEAENTVPSHSSSPTTTLDRPIKALIFTFSLFSLLLCSVILIHTLTELPSSMPISTTFLLTIPLPLLIHHHELVVIAKASYLNKRSSALLVAEGGTLHTALVVVPFLVLLSWAVSGRPPLTLQTLQTPLLPLVAAGLAAWVSGVVLQDGRSNYLKGAVLLVL